MADNALILASGSPRRRELLAQLVPCFEVRPCPLSEPRHKPDGVSPAHWAEALAYFKARSVADVHPGRWTLGADTIVVCADRILGKPRDEDHARAMLELQARHVSDVLTGVALVLAGRARARLLFHAVTRVWMRNDRRERLAYLAGGDWAGKAGAYGIQDIGDRLVERIEGSFTNVVGLPIERLGAALPLVGIPIIPRAAGEGGSAPHRA